MGNQEDEQLEGELQGKTEDQLGKQFIDGEAEEVAGADDAVPQPPAPDGAAQPAADDAVPQPPAPDAGTLAASDASCEVADSAAPQDASERPVPPAGGRGAHSVAKKPTGVASLVLGILSILTSTVFGIVLGAIGLHQARKVLKVDEGCGKAKAGKVTSIIGIVLGVLTTAALIAAIVFGAMFVDSDRQQALQAADGALESVIMPSDDERKAMAAEIESTIESSGLSFDSMGLTADEFSEWMFKDSSYTVGDSDVDSLNGTATVSYTVTTQKVDALIESVSKASSGIDTSALNSEKDLYKEIGKIMKKQMEESKATTKDVSLTVTRGSDGTWSVDTVQLYSLEYTVFYEHE